MFWQNIVPVQKVNFLKGWKYKTLYISVKQAWEVLFLLIPNIIILKSVVFITT